MGGIHDVREPALEAARGHVLAAGQLLDVANLARASGRVRRTLARLENEAPLLGVIGAGLPDLDALRRLIGGALDDRGEVVDNASADLAAIRREISEVHDRLQQRMESLLRSPGLRTALAGPHRHAA